MSNLLHNVPLIHKVAVVNESGDVKGYLRVSIEPIIEDKSSKPTKSGVIQSARLNFRKEDFVKAKKKSNENENQGSYASSETDSGVEDLDAEFPKHIRKDGEFSFRVTVIETVDIPIHYSDVFCQFK